MTVDGYKYIFEMPQPGISYEWTTYPGGTGRFVPRASQFTPLVFEGVQLKEKRWKNDAITT